MKAECRHKASDALCVRLPDGERFSIICGGEDCSFVHCEGLTARDINESPFWSKFFGDVVSDSMELSLFDLIPREPSEVSKAVATFKAKHSAP